MSVPTIAPYFPFRRIRIVNQTVTSEATGAHIQVQPDKRFQPICHGCGQRAGGVHSWTRRKVRDLHLATARLWITCQYRKVFCAHCQGIHIEDLELFHPYLRVDDSIGPLYLSAVPVYDRIRSGSTPGSGLENGQSHRQVLFGTRSWSTRLPGATYFSRGRNLHSKRSPLLDHCTGLSQWPRGLCRQRPQGQNPGEVFHSVQCQAAQRH